MVNVALVYLATFFLVDGIGCLAAVRHTNDKTMFRVVGVSSLLVGLAFASSSFISEERFPGIVRSIMIFATLCLFFAVATQRYKMWDHNWKPVNAIAAKISDKRLFANMLEMRIYAIIWIASVMFLLGKLNLPIWVLFPWYITGGIACVRAFDPPASVGIAINARIRTVLLWITRSTAVIAVLAFILFLMM